MKTIQTLITDHLDIWTAAETEKKSGRGRSSGNAASVYGVKKLRELIYELAATGKIVDHKNDAKQYLLGEVSEFVMGQAPPGNECNTNGDGVIFVKTGEFGLLFPEVKEWTTKPLKLAKNGDVLICVVGATIGKLNLAIDCAIGRSVAAIRPAQIIETKYLYFVLIPFTLRLREKSRGSAQGVIGKADLSSVKIRVPSINEQRQIVAKVDELMALCDQLETRHSNAAVAHEKLVSHLLGTLTQSQSAEDFNANWQRIAAHFDILFTTEASIDALKQTLLQLAVMGKLVPQNPNDEPASVLLKRIQTEKAKLIVEGKIKKAKPLSPISDDEKPFMLPQGWNWARLKDIVYLLGDGLHGTPKYTPNTGCYFVNGNNLQNGKIVIKHETKTVSSEEMEKHKKNLNERSVLVSINGTIGNVAFYNDENIILGKSACYFNLANPIYKQYLKLLIESPYFINYAMKSVSGTTIMNLSLFSMNNFPLLIPPCVEQHRIVAKVDELMALCDQLKSRIAVAKQLQQKLADVVVEQAISQ